MGMASGRQGIAACGARCNGSDNDRCKAMSRPECCEPPKTCFNCLFSDCINVAPPTADEGAYMTIGHAPDFVDLQRIESRKRKQTTYTLRVAAGCCYKCGKPLTAADGEHKACNACRAKARAAQRAKQNAQKKSREKAAKEKNQVKYTTRKVGGQNEALSCLCRCHDSPRH